MTKAGFAAAAALVGVIAVAYCYEVVARYFFFAPTDWSYALVSYVMCAVIFLAMPEQTRRRAQIAINLLLEGSTPRARPDAAALRAAVRCVACLTGGWLTADETWRQYVQGITTISAWPVPKWWVSIFIPYGMFSSAIYFLRQLAADAAPAEFAAGVAVVTWWMALSGGTTILLVLFLLGVPLFAAFLALNVTGVFVLFGPAGFGLFANSIYSTATLGALSAVPLFIVMGEILFRCGAMEVLFDSLDRLVGRIRGRQYVLLHSALRGARRALRRGHGGRRSARPLAVSRHAQARLQHATLGRHDPRGCLPRPDHSAERAGNHHRALADVSAGKLLVAGIVPGIMLTGMFIVYVLIRVRLDPVARARRRRRYRRPQDRGQRLMAVIRMLPSVFIFFMVMGLIMLGVATPTEAAATGVFAAMVLAAYYRTLSWSMIAEALSSAAPSRRSCSSSCARR